MKTLKILLVMCSMTPEKLLYVKYGTIAFFFFIFCQNASSQTSGGTTAIDPGIVQQVVDKIITDNQEGNPGSKMERGETKDYVNLNFDLGNGIRCNYYFSKLKAKHIFGDLNKDGLEDAVINVVSAGGGNTEYRHLYLFLSENGGLQLKSIGFVADLDDCGGPGSFYPEKIENGMLVGESKCFAKNDPRCCPSIVHKTTVKLENDQLVTMSK